MQRRTFDEEFKKEAILLVIEQGRSVTSVANGLGVHPNTLHKWINQYKEHGDSAFPGRGRLRPEDEELRQLRRKIADLEMENAILKKATAIFARHQK
jgi:transposase